MQLNSLKISKETWIGSLIGVVITIIALKIMMDMISEINPKDIFNYIKNISAFNIFMSIIITITCYLFLSLYDKFALITLNKKIKWNIILAGSFSAYSLSHNLGMAPVTAAAARYRIYKSHFVSLPDVIRIGISTGVAFWMGILTVGGIVLIINQDAIMQINKNITSEIVKITGFLLILVNIIYLLYIYKGKKNIGWKNISYPLPNIKVAILQNFIGFIEILLASAILWFLIPGASIENYPIIFIAYLLAFISVLITHAPGGVGVLELTILTIVTDIDNSALIAGLLLFRLIFHIIPFILSIIILTLNPTKNIQGTYNDSKI